MPSKVIAYMLSGRPIIGQVHPSSDCAHLITEAECGWVVAPDSPQLLTRQMEEILHMDHVDFYQMGEKGRNYALGNLSKEACLPKVLEILDNSISM